MGSSGLHQLLLHPEATFQRMLLPEHEIRVWHYSTDAKPHQLMLSSGQTLPRFLSRYFQKYQDVSLQVKNRITAAVQEWLDAWHLVWADTVAFVAGGSGMASCSSRCHLCRVPGEMSLRHIFFDCPVLKYRDLKWNGSERTLLQPLPETWQEAMYFVAQVHQLRVQLLARAAQPLLICPEIMAKTPEPLRDVLADFLVAQGHSDRFGVLQKNQNCKTALFLDMINEVMLLLPEPLRLTSRHCLPQRGHATSVLREQALHALPLSICLQSAFYILLNACVETSL